MATLGMTVAPDAYAQALITGHHDNGNFYDATGPGSYLVGPDTAAGFSATFNNDGSGGNGLLADRNSTVTVSGGQFDNSYRGLLAYFATVTVGDGVFTNNALSGIQETQSTVTVTGGMFSGNAADFGNNNGGTFNVYGQFNGLTPGQTAVLTARVV